MRRRSQATTAAPEPKQEAEPTRRRRPAPSDQDWPAAAPPRARFKNDAASELKIPHDPVNEQVIIAAACVSAKERHRLLLRFSPDSFFAKGHPAIWKLLAEIDSRGLTFDPATVRQLSGGDVDEAYLEQLIEQRPAVPPNLEHHIAALEWDKVRIESVRGPIASLLEALRDPTSDPDSVSSIGRQVATAFSVRSLRYLRDSDELVRSQTEAIRKRQAGLACYPYGIEGFDKYDDDAAGELQGQWRMIPGTAPAMTTVITGLSGTGKTTLTTQIAISFANAKRRTLYGAWEQGSGMTLELMAIQSLGYSRKAFMTGAVTNDEIDQVHDEMDRLAEWTRFFEIPFGRVPKEKRGMMNDKNLDLIHAYIAESGCSIFIADLFRRALREMDPDEEEVALYRMQAITQETKTHSILIHQQRLKDIEQRKDTRPTREGLKGSGAWIEMPDTIIGTHRPGLWKAVDDNIVELVVLKQRHGPWPLAVECDWDPDRGTIVNGRTIEYARPGQQTEVDSFLDEAVTPKRGRGRRRDG